MSYNCSHDLDEKDVSVTRQSLETFLQKPMDIEPFFQVCRMFQVYILPNVIFNFISEILVKFTIIKFLYVTFGGHKIDSRQY